MMQWNCYHVFHKAVKAACTQEQMYVIVCTSVYICEYLHMQHVGLHLTIHTHLTLIPIKLYASKT